MDLTERLIRTAYLQLAIENDLTLIMGAEGLPLVPGTWRREATERALAYLTEKENTNDTV